MNVVLIGMPGAGKSTVGVLAAKALGMDFTDTDLVIQTERGKTLAEIIAERGPSGFSEIEDDTLARLERDNCVIATGGSAVFCEKGMAHLAEGGRTIYLRVEPNDLRARLGTIRTRGVVMREGETLDELIAERAPYYERYADFTVDEHGDIEDTVAEVTEIARSFLGR